MLFTCKLNLSLYYSYCMLMITAVISTVQYLTNKGEHTIVMLYKINKSVYMHNT